MKKAQENYETEKRENLEKDLKFYKKYKEANKTIFRMGLGCLLYFGARYFTGADIDDKPETFLEYADLIAGFAGVAFTLFGGLACIIGHANKKICEKNLKKLEPKNLENIIG